MGFLHYDTGQVSMDDRTLAHLQVVVAHKLRRDEPFMLTWTTQSSSGAGRRSIWIANGVPLRFRFDAAVPVTIDRARVGQMITQSFSAAGLTLPDDRADRAARA